MGFDDWNSRAPDSVKQFRDLTLSSPIATALPVLFGLGIAYLVVRSIYRLYFHPLSHIPGPKIAAISHAYEFYHDAVRGGMYIWEVGKMHEKYGLHFQPQGHTSVPSVMLTMLSRPHSANQPPRGAHQGSALL